jgi:DNA polymerase-1
MAVPPDSVPAMVAAAKKRLYLIDASGHIFRAFYAIPELTTSKGLPTNATLGFTNMVRKLLREQKPDYVVAAFDPPGPTLRHEAFENYKASRDETPEALLKQIPYVRRVCEVLRIPILEVDGYEADDVIGTLARKAGRAGIDVVIVSEDKDLLQLVDDGVTMFAERQGRVTYDRARVQDKYGVPPESNPDLLALMGDSVDDIPGVKGIGAKGAQMILQEYGTIENAIEHAGEITKMKYGEKLEANADMARLSKQLATVATDLPIELDLERFRLEDPDRKLARKLFGELEFRSILEESTESGIEDVDYRTLRSAEELAEALDAARAAGRLSLDLETTHEQPVRADIVGVALSWHPGHGVYLPLAHRTLGADNAMELRDALDEIGPVLTDRAIKLIGQNLKYDLIVLKRNGIEGIVPWFDTMIASYLLHPTRTGHGLDGLALDYLGVKMTPFKDIIPNRGATFDEVPIDAATAYASEDTDVALRLAEIFEPELEATHLVELYRELELPLMHVLADMELAGVRIDSEYLGKMGVELHKQLEELAEGIYAAAGEQFNINSPKQLAEVLFDRLGLPSGGRTAKTGSRSTKADLLEKLADDYPIAGQIIEYRELAKLKGTYVDSLPALVNPETGRLHASFNQTVAATGRLSSSDPNLQNIPIRSPVGRQIRKAFIPADGCLLLAADYSQIELRIMAHLSGDERLKRAFREGEDVHRATAAEIFGVPPEQVTGQQRDRAKVINFGIMYGMGPQRLAREFGISTKEAREFIDNYFEIYADIRGFLESTIEKAKTDGYVTTMLGRIRYLPELQSHQRAVQSFGERIAVNTPLQGTAADMIKRAMVTLHRRLADGQVAARMLIQVHDELVLEVPVDEVDGVSAMVREEMVGAIELDVPLVVDIGTGRNWMEAKA